MKTNKEVLEIFGEKVAQDVFDLNYRILTTNIARNLENGTLKNKAENLVKESMKGLIFDFLRLFEENESFNIYYEKDGQRLSLLEASEMIKSEVVIENGWIERYSKVINKKS